MLHHFTGFYSLYGFRHTPHCFSYSQTIYFGCAQLMQLDFSRVVFSICMKKAFTGRHVVSVQGPSYRKWVKHSALSKPLGWEPIKQDSLRQRLREMIIFLVNSKKCGSCLVWGKLLLRTRLLFCPLWRFGTLWGQDLPLRRSHPDASQSVKLLCPTQRPLPDNTQHSQDTNIHPPGGIRTHNPSKQALADPLLRPRGHWDRQD